ncbi:MAG: undecaprenyldiphospho-muramoylpentapeptide beta-N-acetylglucosaminyltransferase [Gudongella sp.]|nr:undecaprenyldiphospho-muramoylpentapeptide beta-N-acetylglucosaminyltransferase [Gudongella sp.]
MKVIISGGGTGGHIYPALAIAEEIKERYKECEMLYVGTNNSLEQELSQNAGIEFKAIHVKSLPRKLNKKSFIALKELLTGLKDSKKILKDFKPDLVIGTGGYVSAPIVFMAARIGIPAVIHEQNAFPGVANKLLSRFVDKVLITFEESKKYFKKEEKIFLTGNPVRNSLIKINKETAIEELNLDTDKPLVLSFGGSGGQKSLNREILTLIKHIDKKKDLQLIHVTGKVYYDSFLETIKQEGIVLDENLRIVPYYYKMPYAINAAELIITSGGAIALAEISAVGKASILIPKAYTAENHQEYNARAFQNSGASIMILEEELKDGKLLHTVLELVNNKEHLEEMSKMSKNIGNPFAVKKIVDEIEMYLK